VVIVVHVAADGHIDRSAVSGNDGASPSFADCLVNAFFGVVFDAPGGSGATLSVPFNFMRASPGGT
jgi:hypothetical protein